MSLGGYGNIQKLELSRAHLRGGAQYIYKNFMFYRYLKNFAKQTPPPPKNCICYF